MTLKEFLGRSKDAWSQEIESARPVFKEIMGGPLSMGLTPEHLSDFFSPKQAALKNAQMRATQMMRSLDDTSRSHMLKEMGMADAKGLESLIAKDGMAALKSMEGSTAGKALLQNGVRGLMPSFATHAGMLGAARYGGAALGAGFMYSQGRKSLDRYRQGDFIGGTMSALPAAALGFGAHHMLTGGSDLFKGLIKRLPRV